MAMTIEEAKQFVSYNVGEGIYDIDVLDGMTDEEIIEFARYEMARADAYYDAMRKEE